MISKTDKYEIRNPFNEAELKSVCRAITEDGITGSEIGYLLKATKIQDIDPYDSKWERLFNALANAQSQTKNGKVIINFIAKVLRPERFINNNQHKFGLIRERVNKALLFRGVMITEAGKVKICKKASTIPEAEERANKLKKKLKYREVDPFILNFCDAELIKDNYFHAVFEACKGITNIIRQKSKLSGDGAPLIDGALGGKNPILKINAFSTETEKGEQRGFVNLAKGLYGVFRNPIAHEAKIEWDMSEQDALDLLVLASYVVRRLKDIQGAI